MDMPDPSVLPDLEPRFLPPQGWRWHYFVNERGRRIRFGSVFPPGTARGVVVALPGLGEFCEKYFETARDMLARNLAFWILDWQGQGRSDRYFPKSQKRHSTGFEGDLKDLHTFVTDYVRPAVTDPSGARLPAILLGHSMGGNIGLRYLVSHPGFFDAAAFSGPMLRIRALKGLSGKAAWGLTGFFSRAMGRAYAFGATDWRPMHRPPPPLNPVSADPARARLHNAWFMHDPALQVGGVTFGWVHEANRSCAALMARGVLESIDIPCLVAIPDRDLLVDPSATRRAAARLKKGRILELRGCLHEVLMERDVHRNAFLEAFDALLKEIAKDSTVSVD